MSIYDFALKMEHDGGVYYRKVAQQCEDEWLKGIFEFLALEEDKHYNIFKNMQNNKIIPKPDTNRELREYKNIFEIKKDPEFLKSISSTQTEVYVNASEDEKESIKLYEKMLGQIEAEERDILLSIIAEERQHLKFMEEIIELMNKLEEEGL